MGKFIKPLLLFLLVASARLVAQVYPDMDEADLLAVKGKPESKAMVGSKAIYRWPDMEVTVRAKKVVTFKVRDPEAERIAEEHRQRLVEEARAREAAWRAANPPTPAVPGSNTSPLPKTPLQLATERAMRAQRMAELRQQIDGQRQLLEQDSRRFSSPNGGSMSSEQRTAARALIEQYELQIQELERQE